MNRPFLVGVLIGGLGAALGAWLLVGRGSPPPKSTLPPPAEVGKILKEAEINWIRLRPEAVARLGLTTAAVETKNVGRTRVFGGEVTIPPGRTALVAAPFNGLVRTAGKTFPQPGQAVRERQVLLDLVPLLTPEGRANLAGLKIDAEGQVKSAQTQVDAARITFERAERVFKSEAGSKKAVDDARAQYDLAVKQLEAATARSALLDKVVGDAGHGAATALPIESPERGIVRNVSVLPGQNVPAGAPLFEIIDPTRIWVRVPVYLGDLDSIDAKADAHVGPLTADARGITLVARPVDAPPSANAATGTIDVFFELDNPGQKYRPGERVAARLALTGAGDSPIVPHAAIVRDIHGGAWVYEQIGDNTYSRKRVEVRWIDGPRAVLAAGPPAGAIVVVNGAAELFGAETGFTR